MFGKSFIICLLLYCIVTTAVAATDKQDAAVFTPAVDDELAGNDAKQQLEEETVKTEGTQLINDNKELINELQQNEDEDDEEAATALPEPPDHDDNEQAKTSIFYHLTRLYVNRLINHRLRNEPVVKMLTINISPSRVLTLYRVNGYTFRHSVITRISLANYYHATGNSYLAYRPSYTDYHHSSIAAVFINIERLFPCMRRMSWQHPICHMYTNEEDGFNHGRSPVEAGDMGNNFRVFGGRYATYGFGFHGCRTLNKHCLPAHYMATIVCNLPRAYCT